MGKISFDIILTLKNNILGGLVNIKKQFDAIDKAGEQASATTTRFGNICSRLKMPDLNAFLGVAERLGAGRFVSRRNELWTIHGRSQFHYRYCR